MHIFFSVLVEGKIHYWRCFTPLTLTEEKLNRCMDASETRNMRSNDGFLKPKELKFRRDTASMPTVTTIRAPTFAYVIAFLTHRSNKHHNYLLPFMFLQRFLKIGQPFNLKLQLPWFRHVFLTERLLLSLVSRSMPRFWVYENIPEIALAATRLVPRC